MATIPMHSPNGRPWTATTEFEAFGLEAIGYTRDNAAGTPPAEAHDVFTGRPNSALGTTTSGARWIAVGATTPVIRSGAMTFPAGAPTNTAGYALLLLSGRCRRVGGRFRFYPTTGTGGNVTLGAWNNLAIPDSASLHVSITPTAFRISVWSSGAETVLTPAGRATGGVNPFAVPLRTDGATVYSLEVIIDPDSATAWVLLPDGTVAVVRHDLIATVDARYAFWEMFTQNAGDAVGAWVEVGADSQAPTRDEPQALPELTARAAGSPGAGAGPATARPPSAQNPGRTWADTGSGKLTYSDGTAWRDVLTGAVVGNRLAPNQADATLDATGWVPQTNCTRARVTSPTPPGRTSAVKFTSVAAGLIQAFTGGAPVYSDVTAGSSYTAVMSARASVAGRTITPKISWFQTDGTYISGTGGSAVAMTATGFTQALVTATAPALAAKAVIGCDIATAAGAGEEFVIGTAALVAGTVTGYVEP